jgi:D-alanyl-D-alanine carboxypeptidase (penicillin-binding protein 5/6)
LAEGLASGSESSFAQMMNDEARRLGMANSHFMNATGLPDPEHYSTARDLAVLAQALQRDFPEFYNFFSELNFTYNGIAQGNRNPLLYRNMNVDGVKTGHTQEGGFGLTASVVREGRRLIMVMNGMESMQGRADESAKVIDYGYREFGLYQIAKPGDVMGSATVWLGRADKVAVVAGEGAQFTLPRTARNGLKAVVSFTQPIPAPIKQGQVLGELTITAPGMEPKTLPLVAGADVQQVGFFARVFGKLGYMLGGKKG